MAEYFVNQSSFHIAVIMDGNGRWALARGLPRIAGHRAGAEAVRRSVEAAPELGVGILTLFAFSSDNWQRPAEEVNGLMALLGDFLKAETGRCQDNGIRLEVIGRRDRLEPALREAVTRAEALTASGARLHLRLAIDYSGREAIVAAARQLTELSGREIARALGPPVDLLIRTGGERRLSDFLLWECAYAELIFSRRMWPEFGAADLAGAIREYHGRERRFGAIPHTVTGGKPDSVGAWLD